MTSVRAVWFSTFFSYAECTFFKHIIKLYTPLSLTLAPANILAKLHVSFQCTPGFPATINLELFIYFKYISYINL